jgi:hypothetical protein
LLQGSILALDIHINSHTMVGDTNAINQLINKKYPLDDYKLASILAWVSQEVSRFHKINLFHVSRENNIVTNPLANKATLIKMGVLRVYGTLAYQTIP